MQSKLTNRQKRVIEIRDIVVGRVMIQGKWTRVASSRVPGGEIPWFRYEGGGFTISLRTPFEKRQAPPDVLKLFSELKGQGIRASHPTLPWQLEIWPGEGLETEGKVLNVEWDDCGTLLITSFRRGLWEERVLQWKAADESKDTARSPNVGARTKQPGLRLVTSQTL